MRSLGEVLGHTRARARTHARTNNAAAVGAFFHGHRRTRHGQGRRRAGRARRGSRAWLAGSRCGRAEGGSASEAGSAPAMWGRGRVHPRVEQPSAALAKDLRVGLETYEDCMLYDTDGWPIGSTWTKSPSSSTSSCPRGRSAAGRRHRRTSRAEARRSGRRKVREEASAVATGPGERDASPAATRQGRAPRLPSACRRRVPASGETLSTAAGLAQAGSSNGHHHTTAAAWRRWRRWRRLP